VSGNSNQGTQAVAVGWSAGQFNQGNYTTAIGVSAGYDTQGTYATAIGFGAGNGKQGLDAIAVGRGAGSISQSSNAVAFGVYAGGSNQSTNAVAIGFNAGYYRQGSNAVAIGAFAGYSNQSTNTIILNATGRNLNTTFPSSFYVAPVRLTAASGFGALKYNPTSFEVTYDTSKTFVIDHPKDDSKYLVHACLEGPEAGVYYRGTGTIADLESSAEILLPDYVDTLATDFTVQVTPIYNGSVRVLNTSCVSNSRFTVYGDSGDFHWHVYGRRAAVNVEPKKSDAKVHGEGPYRWIA